MMIHIAILLVLTVIIYILIRTLTFKTISVDKSKSVYISENLSNDKINRLSHAIKLKTVSNSDYSKTDFDIFEEFIKHLEVSFPLVHNSMELKRINSYALLYRWKGENSNKNPVLFTSHYDVVPVEAGTESKWKYDGFSGAVREGRIWGRGTLDIKSQVMALMEAAEKLIKEDFTPENDIYFAFGHDEEVGGTQGAKKISEHLEENNIKLDAVYDEGGLVISGAVSGVSSPIALVGTAEKGYCDVELSISAYGGHSSTPPKETALGIISKIINSIEKNPMAASLSSPVKEMLGNICHEMGFAVKMAVANLWLFKPVLFKLFSGSASTNAMIRTTIVPTVINAGEAANVIPQNAKCIFNIRLIPGDSGSDVLNHIKNLSKRYNAVLTPITIEEPSKISPTNTEGYNKLISSIKKFYPNAIPTPYLVMGGTDARKYYNVCDNIYRFTPIWVTDEEKDTMHSHNESISVENYLRMIDFFEIMFKKY